MTKRTPINGTFVAHFYILPVTLLLSFYICSCQSDPLAISKAQDAFEKAIAAESALNYDAGRHFDDYNIDIFAPLTARRYYLAALQRTSEVCELTGVVVDAQWDIFLVAKTLKSLCLWKLGMYSKAIDLSKEVSQCVRKDPQTIPLRQTRALLIALPGLILLDKVEQIPLDHRADERGMERLQELLLKEGAAEYFSNSRGALQPDNPFNSYLIQAELAAHRSYLSAARAMFDADRNMNRAKWHTTYVQPLEKRVANLMDWLNGLLPNGRESYATLESWQQTFAQYFSMFDAMEQMKR